MHAVNCTTISRYVYRKRESTLTSMLYSFIYLFFFSFNIKEFPRAIIEKKVFEKLAALNSRFSSPSFFFVCFFLSFAIQKLLINGDLRENIGDPFVFPFPRWKIERKLMGPVTRFTRNFVEFAITSRRKRIGSVVKWRGNSLAKIFRTPLVRNAYQSSFIILVREKK